MAFEKITLDVNANGEMPTFHCKQFDIGRPIIIDLVAGEDEYTPAAGVTFELHCRKVDMNLVVISDYEIDSNQITFASTQQLTACVGDNLATLKMFKDELEIGTMNFFINVAIDPEAQGIVSDTVIDNLTTQIEDITEQVIGDNYYDKEEVDDLLDLKADAADVYTKTQVDTALSLKADKSTTYTKSQVDDALSLKADKSDTYTKAQVDSALSAKANTADLATVATTGDYDDLLNKPSIPAAQVQSDYAQSDNTQVDYIKNKPDINGMIASYIDDLLPTKSASGSIANFTTALAMKLKSCTVDAGATIITACGVNLWDEEWEVGGISWATGQNSSENDRIRSKNYIPVKPSITVNFSYTNDARFVWCYDATKTLIENVSGSNNYFQLNAGVSTLTLPANCCYIRFILWTTYGTTYNNNVSINYPATDTTYNPYMGNTYPIADKDNIVTLRGVNNIYTDSGDVTVQYKDTTL